MSKLTQKGTNTESRVGRIAALFVISGFLVLTGLSSCKKDGPTKALITVVDSLNRPVQAASVTLWQDTSTNSVNGVQSKVRITKKSDAAGRAEFEFKLEAFLNIEVIKNDDTARSFIRLKEHETVTKTVSL